MCIYEYVSMYGPYVDVVCIPMRMCAVLYPCLINYSIYFQKYYRKTF